ncbi:MAG: bifunctional hydroxymethylpyrimidine kinase/phosphomethylpyrimidine kinase [Bacteroidaceae bacterium]|nr:bifunctional hydroxymethylpyrimidine kinase/phosphomethylpyrimidine kinase [Bacteroidaceae bacterium]
MTNTKILLVGDFVGYGRLAIGAQASVLMRKGYSVSYLPTALVSNNFCYQQYAILDTTAYMWQTLDIWRKLGFSFNLISIGFIASDEQADMLSVFCNEQKKSGALVVLDPIMADNGSLYSGIGEETVQRLRRMIGISDITLPNYTEACYLADHPYSKQGMKTEEAEEIVNKLRTFGAKSILITSAKIDGVPHVVGYDDTTKEYLRIPYREVPVEFSGTGDIFSARLIHTLVQGKTLKASAQITMEKLSALIDTYQDVENKLEGLPY